MNHVTDDKIKQNDTSTQMTYTVKGYKSCI